MANPGSASYTPGYNDRIYANTNDNYQASYTIVAYTNPIPLLNISIGPWPNYTTTNNNMMRFPTYGPPERSGFGYEIPSQFSYRPQPDEMAPA
jgi:hypothetical protein